MTDTKRYGPDSLKHETCLILRGEDGKERRVREYKIMVSEQCATVLLIADGETFSMSALSEDYYKSKS